MGAVQVQGFFVFYALGVLIIKAIGSETRDHD